jgi:hypothetical protein
MRLNMQNNQYCKKKRKRKSDREEGGKIIEMRS